MIGLMNRFKQLALVLPFLVGCSAQVDDSPADPPTVPGGCPAFRLDSNINGTVVPPADPQWLAITFDSPARLSGLTLHVADGAALPILFNLAAIPTNVDLNADGTGIGYSVTWSHALGAGSVELADGTERFTPSDNRATRFELVAKGGPDANGVLTGVSVECR